MILNWIGRRAGARKISSRFVLVAVLGLTTVSWPWVMRARAVEPDVKILLLGNQLLNDVGAQVREVVESSGRTVNVTLRNPSNWTLADHLDSGISQNSRDQCGCWVL